MDTDYGAWDSIFREHRAYLVSFAFRMTGSLADAEDLVHDTFLECAQVELASIDHPRSWLTKVCSNKGLDYLRSAQKKRETYPGTWLPDQIPQGLSPWDSSERKSSPEESALMTESLTTSFLLLLERLSPVERVVFLLCEVFGYSFLEIGKILDRREDSCRKIAERARTSVKKRRRSFKPKPEGSEKVIVEFFSYAKAGDVQKMVQLLSADSELWGDGGGRVKAGGFLNQRPQITEFLQGLTGSGIFNSESHKLEFRPVNQRPGVVISRKLETGLWCFDTILSFEMVDGQIARIYAQRNPEKLAALSFT